MKKPFISSIRNVSKYILLVILTSIIFLSIFISLPQTERVYEKTNFNLNLIDKNYWKKEYIITLEFQPEELDRKWQLINQTKNVISNRLNRLNIEHYKFDYNQEDEKKGTLKVTVESTKDNTNVETVISARADLKLVTRKDGVNFDDEANSFAQYDPTNYVDANLWRNDFRTIYITKLRTTSGDEAFFGIFKPWIWKSKEFDSFLSKNSGQMAGVYIDGFISPIQVPIFNPDTSQSAKPILSIGLTTTASSAFLQDIIYNSGTIPISYSYQQSKDLEINNVIDYKKLLLFGILCLFITIVLSTFIFKLDPMEYLLSITILGAIFIAYMKIFHTPITTNMLILHSSFTLLLSLLMTITKQKMFTITLLLLTLGLLYLIPFSIMSSTALWLIILTVGNIVVYELTKNYIYLFKSVLRK